MIPVRPFHLLLQNLIKSLISISSLKKQDRISSDTYYWKFRGVSETNQRTIDFASKNSRWIKLHRLENSSFFSCSRVCKMWKWVQCSNESSIQNCWPSQVISQKWRNGPVPKKAVRLRLSFPLWCIWFCQKISYNGRIGKYASNQKRPRTLLVCLSNPWDVKKIPSKGYMLKEYGSPICLSRALNRKEQKLEHELIQTRRELINADESLKNIKIRHLKLTVKSKEICPSTDWGKRKVTTFENPALKPPKHQNLPEKAKTSFSVYSDLKLRLVLPNWYLAYTGHEKCRVIPAKVFSFTRRPAVYKFCNSAWGCLAWNQDKDFTLAPLHDNFKFTTNKLSCKN